MLFCAGRPITPTGTRTPVFWLRTRHPRPLDDGGLSLQLLLLDAIHVNVFGVNAIASAHIILQPYLSAIPRVVGPLQLAQLVLEHGLHLAPGHEYGRHL